jgi:hypothetical protein
MTQAKIKSWINYWTAANLVAFHEINSAADVANARRFCAVMRNGVFCDVADNSIWQALQSLRNELLAA